MDEALPIAPARTAGAARPAACSGRPAFDAATAQALTEGGDERLHLDGGGRNRYGCRPWPDLRLLDFASSTASVVSPAGFEAAARLKANLDRAPGSLPRWQDALAHELAALTGADRVPGAQLRLAASGTDVHRMAARLAAQGRDGSPAAVTALMVEPDETGSGIGTALACGSAPAGPMSVRLRHDDGTPRPAALIDRDFAEQARRIVARGHRCLLVLMDVSKTGLVAPTPACALALQRELGERLAVLVDACQYRLGIAATRRYLEVGWMVALTGSKFVAGPAFSGALLLPAPWAGRSPAARAPAGLLLRWEAALAELRRFRAVPGPAAAAFVQAWGTAVAARLAADPRLCALPVPPLAPRLARVTVEAAEAAGAAGADDEAGCWDRLQTIFPFTLRGGIGRGLPLDRAQTAQLHRRLQQGWGVHLGQPVACGWRDGAPVSALRLNLSARWVAAAAGDPVATRQAIDAAMRALDAVAAGARAIASEPRATVGAPSLQTTRYP